MQLFLCVFCSLGLCWEGESTRGIWGNDVSPLHLLLWFMKLKHKQENTSVCNLAKTDTNPCRELRGWEVDIWQNWRCTERSDLHQDIPVPPSLCIWWVDRWASLALAADATARVRQKAPPWLYKRDSLLWVNKWIECHLPDWPRFLVIIWQTER